jgi:hypothetical protein
MPDAVGITGIGPSYAPPGAGPYSGYGHDLGLLTVLPLFFFFNPDLHITLPPTYPPC